MNAIFDCWVGKWSEFALSFSSIASFHMKNSLLSPLKIDGSGIFVDLGGPRSERICLSKDSRAPLQLKLGFVRDSCSKFLMRSNAVSRSFRDALLDSARLYELYNSFKYGFGVNFNPLHKFFKIINEIVGGFGVCRFIRRGHLVD